ncbi:MAG: ribulose-phosphate 3-epimerase [Pirellulaceae bacterium]|nr:ribulose-phosphate 3-epimerase [Pirellulaceae bacterium]
MNHIEKSIDSLRSHRPLILPSMLMCDFSDIREQCRLLQDGGAEALHLDVMDGRFVPNLSYGLPIVAAFRESTDMLLDVHLMMYHPENYISQFADAGADILTIHQESTENAGSCIDEIHRCGVLAGIAVNPDTDLDLILDVAPSCDLVLIMSVHAGFGGQTFIDQSISRIETMRDHSENYLLEVDGGINASTIGNCANAGVDLFVVGSALFNQKDYGSTLSHLAGLAEPHKDNA